jgi:hypothetical protein
MCWGLMQQQARNAQQRVTFAVEPGLESLKSLFSLQMYLNNVGVPAALQQGNLSHECFP